MKKKNIHWILILSIPLLFISACLGVETELRFNEDGSGIAIIKYRISNMIVHLGTTNGDSVVPLPISEDDFGRTVAAVDGLRLISIERDDSDEDVIITAEIEFENIEAFSKIESFTNMPATLVRVNGTYAFEQVIALGDEEPIDEDSLEMIDVIFYDYTVSFIVNTTDEIIEYNLGELSDDRRRAKYEISVADLLRLDSRTVFVVTW